MRKPTRRGYALLLSIPAAVLLAGSTALATGAIKAPHANPEAGLSDAQRNQLYQNNWNQFQTHYEAWLAGLNYAKLNWRKLSRSPQDVSTLPAPGTSLPSALSAADVVVHARAVSVRPTAFDGTFVTIQVLESYKGSARGAVLTVHQGGGLRPTPDWSGAFIADAPDAPLMLPGDEVVALLNLHNGQLFPEPYTGLYWIANGVTHSVALNPFGQSFESKSASLLDTTIRENLHSAGS